MSMFTVGEYSFPRVVESHMKMYKTYGPIVHECLGDMHFVRLFDPQVSATNVMQWVFQAHIFEYAGLNIQRFGKQVEGAFGLSRKRVIRRR